MGKTLKPVLILLGLSYIFFMLGNSILSLTNPDEVFYAGTAKEMIQQKTWATPYIFGAPQFEKPIFLYWLMRIGFMVSGVSAFSARFFPAFFAGLGVIALYFLAALGFKNEKKAFLSALILLSSGVYIGLARTVFTDMVFSVLILFSILSFYWGYSCSRRKGLGILLFFIFAALAVLTKGPLGIFIPLLVVLVFLLIRKETKFLCSKYSLWGLIVFIIISFPWYILMFKKYGTAFWQEFFYNDHIRRLFEAEHAENDTWYFYPASMVGCMFPWSLYVLAALISFFRHLWREKLPVYLFLACWIGMAFLIFQPAHSKLVSYIFPLFPALAMITADFIDRAALSGKKSRLFSVISFLTLFGLLCIPVGLIVGMPYYSVYISSKMPVYVIAPLLFLLAALFCIFLLKRKFLEMLFTLSLLILPILFGALAMHKDIEPYVSSKLACEYLLKNYPVGDSILCAKPFARGVRYYTGREIAVMDTPGLNFFSPHPIPFLNTDEKVLDYLSKHPVLYCVFKRSSVEKIHAIVDPKREYKAALLKIIGNVYLVKVEPNKKGN